MFRCPWSQAASHPPSRFDTHHLGTLLSVAYDNHELRRMWGSHGHHRRYDDYAALSEPTIDAHRKGVASSRILFRSGKDYTKKRMRPVCCRLSDPGALLAMASMKGIVTVTSGSPWKDQQGLKRLMSDHSLSDHSPDRFRRETWLCIQARCKRPSREVVCIFNQPLICLITVARSRYLSSNSQYSIR